MNQFYKFDKNREWEKTKIVYLHFSVCTPQIQIQALYIVMGTDGRYILRTGAASGRDISEGDQVMWLDFWPAIISHIFFLK